MIEPKKSPFECDVCSEFGNHDLFSENGHVLSLCDKHMEEFESEYGKVESVGVSPDQIKEKD